MTSQNLNTTWSSKLSDNHSKGSFMMEHSVLPILEEGYSQEPCQGRVTMDVLPDNALLEIFHFYKDDTLDHHYTLSWRWETLAQVCRRWRHVVFGSPRRLDLRLVCTRTTPVSRLLDIWPPFPITVFLPYRDRSSVVDKNGMENIIAALECRDRISNLFIFDIRGPELEKLVDMLHEPLPFLTGFSLYSEDESAPVLPETFLGGSAPCLQTFMMKGVPFPAFPKLILCFTHIATLRLEQIPNSGYISPEVMVTCLTPLPHLFSLSIGFRSPPSGLLQLSPPPLTRAALPALSDLTFSGASEYFEDFVARIDAPRLTSLEITFFMDLIFDIPRLRNFIDRTEGLKPFNQAAIEFSGGMINTVFGSPTRFELGIKCERPDWQLSSITQIFSEQLPLLSHVEQLQLREFFWSDLGWKDDPDMDSSQWLELFRLFVAAQTLHISEILVSPVSRALQDLTGHTATEVLPVLRTLFVEGLQPLSNLSLTEHTSLASPDLFNPSDFLTSPVSPWDDLLTTPALDADVSMTPEIYTTNPTLVSFGDDFDNIPSLFGSTSYDGYDTKAAVGSSLSPSNLPLPDTDMYTISLGTPAIDWLSLQASSLRTLFVEGLQPLSNLSLTEHTSLASPDLFNPSDFLTSPVSPWDDFLTTPTLDADVSMTPEIYTSPTLVSFGDDFDNIPSLFGSTSYDGYDTKAAVGSSLSPSDLPLLDMDTHMISPGTPAIDSLSLQASSLRIDDSSVPQARRKNVPTGTRQNITLEPLVPFDAPIQTRKYRLPSTTSRKELPTTAHEAMRSFDTARQLSRQPVVIQRWER